MTNRDMQDKRTLSPFEVKKNGLNSISIDTKTLPVEEFNRLK